MASKIHNLSLIKLVINNPNLKGFSKSYETSIMNDDYYIVKNKNIEVYKVDNFEPKISYFHEIILNSTESGELINMHIIDNQLFIICMNKIYMSYLHSESKKEITLIDEYLGLNLSNILYFMYDKRIKYQQEKEKFTLEDFNLVLAIDNDKIYSGLTSNEDKDILEVTELVSFISEIIDFKYVFIEKTKKLNSVLLLFALTKTNLYISRVKHVIKDYKSFQRFLKNKFNWTSVSLDNKQIKYFDVFTDSFNYEFKITLISDSFECHSFSVYREENNNNTSNNTGSLIEVEKIDIKNSNFFNINKELKDSCYSKENLKLLEFNSISRFYDMLYISFDKRLVLYNISQKTIIHMWNFNTESLKKINLLFSHIKPDYYFLFSLTNRNLYYVIINNELENFNYNKSLGPEYFTQGLKLNFKEELCVICRQKSKKRCSSCKEAYYCSIEHQELDWVENHQYYCFGKLDNEVKDECDIKYKDNVWLSKRKSIVLCFKSSNKRTIIKGLILCSKMIEQNTKTLFLTIKNITQMNKLSSYKKPGICKAIVNFLQNTRRLYM